MKSERGGDNVNRRLHSLKIRSHLTDAFVDIFMDGEKLDGVSKLTLDLEAKSIPTATITFMLNDADVSLSGELTEVGNDSD